MSADNVDLSPRPGAAVSRRPKWVATAVVVAVAAAVVILIWVLVSNSQAFLEADVAVTEREEQGDKRFQLLGSPIDDAAATVVVGDDEFTSFTIAFDGVKVDVLSEGSPPDLFAQGVPVVLEGQWVRGTAPVGVSWPNGANDGWYFSTDRILVKHDNDYRQERIDDAEDRGQVDAAATE